MMDTIRVLSCLAVTILSTINAQERRCDVPADVVFLMDASDSIKDTEWEQEKDFVSVLIDNLEVDRYAIHVGVIVYSTELGQVIDLQPFKTKNQLKGLLKQAVQINQGTDTAKAISKMVEMFDNQGRVEAGAKQIGVIITDGRSTDVSATVREARRARLQFNIEMIALGVGNETFLEELVEIAGPENTNRLFQVKDFAQLRDVVAQLQDLICEIIPATTTPEPTTSTTTTTLAPTTSPNIPLFPCSNPADVVFLIDGSYSISPPDWVKGKQFVSYLINSIDIGVDSVHVGIVVYGSDIGDVVPLQPFKTKADLIRAASELIQPPVGRTNTALGLQRVRDMFNTQSRPHVPHIAIVITDGMSSNPSETRDQAIEAKREGITIFVVGVGNRVLRQELEEMASSPRSLFDAPDFKFLVGMVQLLRDNICTAIQVTTTTVETSPTTPAMTTRPPVPELCKQCLVEGGVGFNPFPTDCEKYVICLPQALTYEPHVKSCPFGMFWSSESVSCLDARYVDCPYDKCKTLPEAATYPSSSSGCRSYFRCSNGKSVPHCCETGHTYVKQTGCSPDTSCSEPCPLNVTIFNQGACMSRPDPDSYYSYLDVIPGQGHVRRHCPKGLVYSQQDCACSFDSKTVVSSIACKEDVNLPFDGGFENHAPVPQPVNVHHVDLTNSGTAYFRGDSSLTFPATAGKDFGDKFVIKLKFRSRGDNKTGEIWNKNGEWGFQYWFQNATNHGNPHSVVIGNSKVPDPGTVGPRGAVAEPLEVINFARDGTIIRDPRYVINGSSTELKINQSLVDVIHLRDLGSLTSPSIINGIAYVPLRNEKLLIHGSDSGVSGSVRPVWKLISLDANGKTGNVLESGEGAVPRNVQEKHGFDLRPPVLERWFILAPGGIVLHNGEGPIPEDVRNRYAGFTPGTVVKVFESGGELLRWQIFKPDGSQLQEGQGSIPSPLMDAHKLDKVLSPHLTATTWSILSSDGKVLETGTGDVPAAVSQKYLSNPSITILKSTSQDGRGPYWEVSRPSGVKVLEGHGAFPPGISRFVQGEIPLPQISSVNKWTVTLPDGTVKTGTGKLPQDIVDLFLQMSPQTEKINRPVGKVINKWTVTLPDGTVRSGEGDVPEDIKAMMGAQGSSLEKRWQVTMPDGSVKSGVGEMPSQILGLLQGLRNRRAVNAKSQTMDLISNCGMESTPSIHLSTSDHDVTLNLLTSLSPTGVTVSLPIEPGMNDVMFVYDGSHLTGLANGYRRKLPLKGDIETRASPLVVGQCLNRPDSSFVGEIDQLEIYFCLP